MVAKSLKNQSGMPKIMVALSGWESVITLSRVTQIMVEGDLTETFQNLVYTGTVQPLKPELLQLKDEGLRAFKWLMIHCYVGGAKLRNNDRLIYETEKYIVMGVNDYTLNNYMEYHLIEDYKS